MTNRIEKNDDRLKDIQIFLIFISIIWSHKLIIFVSIKDTKKHKIMTKEIEEYIDILNNIDEILKNSPFKMSYIIEKSGIKKPTFFKNLKEKRFTPEELLVIAKTIEIREWNTETSNENSKSLTP